MQAQRRAQHVVRTFPRGWSDGGRPGYAAACETPDCGAITFGGFTTRLAAREALRGHEITSPPVIDGLSESPRDSELEA